MKATHPSPVRGRKFMHDDLLKHVTTGWRSAQQVRFRMPRYSVSTANAEGGLRALFEQGKVERRVNDGVVEYRLVDEKASS